MKRNQPSICGPTVTFETVNAQPTAETRKRIAIAHRVGRRPNRSLGLPAVNTPISVPMSAPEMMSPCQNELRPNSFWIAFSAPEMTPESKPNRKPPSEATTETYNKNLFIDKLPELLYLTSREDARRRGRLRFDFGEIVVVHLVEAVGIAVTEIRCRTSVETTDRLAAGHPLIVLHRQLRAPVLEDSEERIL